MQADMDELVHVKLEGELAELLMKVDLTYETILTHEGNKPIIYAELDKALYGTLQVVLLFWKKIQKSCIEKHGFKANRYDSCVVNKDIAGQQCTIGWHVDDIKISHCDAEIAENIVGLLDKEYGKEAPLVVTWGKVHEYLRMTVDFSEEGKVKFYMQDYIKALLAEAPEEIMKGSAAMPAANHLFQINPVAIKLDMKQAETFHHLMAKLLYLCKCTRPNLQTAVAFLTTRVQNPDIDDFKKLG